MFQRMKAFLTETRIEMKKVTWPTTAELKESTRVVIVATFILTAFIGAVDQVLSSIVKLVFK